MRQLRIGAGCILSSGANWHDSHGKKSANKFYCAKIEKKKSKTRLALPIQTKEQETTEGFNPESLPSKQNKKNQKGKTNSKLFSL